MSFKDQLASDASGVFLNTDEFAEPVTYTPKGGSPKVINAIVDRQRVSPDQNTDHAILNQIEITIANSVTSGVATINKGGDKVSLPERIGGESIDWIVADILSQDEWLWRILLQK